MSLVYEKGRFVQAATRGDGVAGEDVTANVATVKDVPAELSKAGGRHPDVLEVRGEIYMPVADFEAMNKRQADAGERLFVNPRNSAPATATEGPGVTAHAATALLGLRDRGSSSAGRRSRRGRRRPSSATLAQLGRGPGSR